MQSIYRLFLIVMLLLSVGCGAASTESPAEREFSPDTASFEATPLSVPTDPVVGEKSYPVVEATAEVIDAYPVESVLPPYEAAYPVDDETVNAKSANADVTFVRVVETAPNIYTFHVTVAHPDTGWEDYADGWDVVLPDGTVVTANPEDAFTRQLLHPHETEQPFTRSQSNLVLPEDVTQVTVRAHDSVDGFGGAQVMVDLTQESGTGFSVER